MLTAAQCISNKGRDFAINSAAVKVRLGAHNLIDFSEVGSLLASTRKLIFHPSWNPLSRNYDGDAALLMMETEIQFNRYINNPVVTITKQSNCPIHVQYYLSTVPNSKHFFCAGGGEFGTTCFGDSFTLYFKKGNKWYLFAVGSYLSIDDFLSRTCTQDTSALYESIGEVP